MRAKYCKNLNTYQISRCHNCECDHIWEQGIGSLVGQGISDVTQEINTRTITNDSTEGDLFV